MTETDQRPGKDAHALQCREVWGGIEATDSSVDVPGLDTSIVCRPWRGDAGGGDVHYVGLCGHGVISRFVVADVAGHGQDVAELAETLRELMRKHMNVVDQSELVAAINEEFGRHATDGRFATAVVLTYDSRYDNLVVVNAGHPRPLWRSYAEGRWRLLTPDAPSASTGLSDLPLGVLPETGYVQFAVHLEPGDVLAVYTDALIEATNPAGKDLGETGLLELASGLPAGSAKETAHRLLAAVDDYRGGHSARDDTTLMLLHHNAENPDHFASCPITRKEKQ